jgi:hypothetical protein
VAAVPSVLQTAITSISPAQEAPSVCIPLHTLISHPNNLLQTNAPENSYNRDPLNVRDPFVCVCHSGPLHSQSDATTRPATVRRHRATTSFATQRLRPSPIVSQQPPTILRHLRKLLPSSFRRGTVLPVQNDEPHDPLNVCLRVLSPLST